MAKAVAAMPTPRDGYVADLKDGVVELSDWSFTGGDAEIHTGVLLAHAAPATSVVDRGAGLSRLEHHDDPLLREPNSLHDRPFPAPGASDPWTDLEEGITSGLHTCQS